MTTNTADQGLILPVATDVNNIPTHMDSLTTGGAAGKASGLESRLVKRYLSAADRTTRNGSPIAGEISWLADVKRWEGYDGTGQIRFSNTLIARASRNTGSATTTTETGVLRIDNIPVLNNHLYFIVAPNCYPYSTVNTDTIGIATRVNFVASPGAGVAATTASPTIGTPLRMKSDPNQPLSGPSNVFYIPAGDGTISVLFTVARILGTGNVSVFGGLDMLVYDHGIAPNNTGIVL